MITDPDDETALEDRMRRDDRSREIRELREATDRFLAEVLADHDEKRRIFRDLNAALRQLNARLTERTTGSRQDPAVLVQDAALVIEHANRLGTLLDRHP